jgi:hypothetical protein
MNISGETGTKSEYRTGLVTKLTRCPSGPRPETIKFNGFSEEDLNKRN